MTVMTVPGFGNEPEGDFLKGHHKGLFMIYKDSLVPCSEHQHVGYDIEVGTQRTWGFLFCSPRMSEGISELMKLITVVFSLKPGEKQRPSA